MHGNSRIKDKVAFFVRSNSIGETARIFSRLQLKAICDFLVSEVSIAIIEGRTKDITFLERERQRFKSKTVYIDTGTTQKRIASQKRDKTNLKKVIRQGTNN